MAEELVVVRRMLLTLVCVAMSACTQAPTSSGSASPSMPVSAAATTAAPSPSSDQATTPASPKIEMAWQSRGSLLGVGHGIAFVGGDVRLRAFEVSCRRNCGPVFTSRLSTSSEVLVHGGRAFIGTGHGVAIVDLACRDSCEPVAWLLSNEVGRPHTHTLLSDPANSYEPMAVSDDVLVVQQGWDGAAGSGIFPSRLAGYTLDCAATCHPLWTTPLGNGRRPPAVAGDVLLAPRAGVLDAFTCMPSSARCSPRWSADLAGPGADATWTETPLVVGDSVIVSTDGCVGGTESGPPIVAAYPLACSFTCEPLWRTRLHRTRFQSGVAQHDGLVYVATEGPGGARPVAFGMQLSCNGACEPAVSLDLPRGDVWQTPLPYRGGVFLGSRTPGSLVAFDGACRGSCAPERTLELPKSVGEVVALGRSLLVASGSDLFLVPLAPGAGRWRPSWRWRGGAVVIDRVIVDDRVALVSYPQRTIAVPLP
jgi:hypothetical protein